MKSRRDFLRASGALTLGSFLVSCADEAAKTETAVYNGPKSEIVKNVGIQLYTLRKEMAEDAVGTLKKLAKIGYKQLESARSDKGNYYGLQPKEIKKIVEDMGMQMRSGHVHIDENWQQSIDQAAEAGQEYLICSTMPSSGQTVENYQRVADAFSKAGEDCKKANLVFGYHNHDYEFAKAGDQVLYDVLLEKSDPSLVKMEMDLGWVVAAGGDPMHYFEKYPGRFPLWHLKDMDLDKKHSTEFGKGKLNIVQLLQSAEKSGMKYYFVEQEEYTSTPFESLQYNYDYLAKLKGM
jgi:sugar phosphate isomerase/epimerase